MLLFSGRPNPCWRTTVDEGAQISRRIAYDVLASAVPRPTALGYNGFLLRNFEPGEGDGRAAAIHVRCGVLAITTCGANRYYADVAGLENYLLQAAYLRGAIPGGIDLHQ